MRYLTTLAFIFVVFYTGPITAQAVNTAANTFRDPRDGHVYSVVTIAAHQWFADNLAYLPSVGNGILVYGYNGKDVSEARQSDSYRHFAALYDWASAMTSCPAGWRLPTEEEWTGLELAFGPLPPTQDIWQGTEQGNRLKQGGDSGFKVLLGGWMGGKGFNFQGQHANFWTATSDGDRARERLFNVNRAQVGHDWGNKTAAFSVRCIR